jgi:hypothetical protein
MHFGWHNKAYIYAIILSIFCFKKNCLIFFSLCQLNITHARHCSHAFGNTRRPKFSSWHCFLLNIYLKQIFKDFSSKERCQASQHSRCFNLINFFVANYIRSSMMTKQTLNFFSVENSCFSHLCACHDLKCTYWKWKRLFAIPLTRKH